MGPGGGSHITAVSDTTRESQPSFFFFFNSPLFILTLQLKYIISDLLPAYQFHIRLDYLLNLSISIRGK